MTHFPAHTASRISNRAKGVLHLIAADEGCEYADIIKLITPLAPASHAPAADTPAAPPASETDGEGRNSSPEPAPSVDPIPETVNLVSDEPPTPPSHQGEILGEKGTAPCDTAAAGKTAEASASAAPKRRNRDRGKQVEAVIREHPDWPDQVIAEHLGVSAAYIRMAAVRLKLPLASRHDWRKAQQEQVNEALRQSQAKPVEAIERAGPPTPRAEPQQPPAGKSVDPKRLPIKHQVANLHSMHPDWDAARIAQEIGAKLNTVTTALSDARAAARESLSEPIPPANPQRPVAPPPVGELKTLNDRVRALHQQHPNWTGRMIANELGANPNSVSVALARIRNPKAEPAPVEQPQFTGRRQMIEHYGEIAKRLGKPS